MPNTKPATINQEQLDIKVKIAENQAFCNYSFFIGAAKENIDKLDVLEKLEGCWGKKSLWDLQLATFSLKMMRA